MSLILRATESTAIQKSKAMANTQFTSAIRIYNILKQQAVGASRLPVVLDFFDKIYRKN